MTDRDSFDASRGALIAELGNQFPAIPTQSVIGCVLDAWEAVEYMQVNADGQQELVARLARAHLDELAAFYVSTDAPAPPES